MPYTNLKVTEDGVFKSQKKQTVKEMKETLVNILGKKPEHKHKVIDGVDTENWGFSGILTADYKQLKD